MAKKINIKGVIIPNNYKFYYNWFGMDSCCPADVERDLNDAKGAEVEVYINSPGGIIDAGSEIYTMLRSYKGDVKIYIVGEACSAASVIAMAGYCEMSPTALMMVHCVSTGNYGNHSVFEHTAEVLRTADEALCTAYMAKSGMSKEDALAMMEHETWMNAEKAMEMKLIDAIMFENKEPVNLVASLFALPSAEQLQKVENLLNQGSNQDGLSAFLDDKCTIDPNEKAPASALYEAYCSWCEENDQATMSQKRFGGLLAERGLENKRGTGGPYWWHGITVNEVNDDGQGSPSLTGANSALLRAKLNLLKLKGETR